MPIIINSASQKNVKMSDHSVPQDLVDSWTAITGNLKQELGAQIHGQWIRPIRLGGFDADSGTLHLVLPSEFSARWVRDRFADRLTLAWKQQHDGVRALEIVSATRAGSVNPAGLGFETPAEANANDASVKGPGTAGGFSRPAPGSAHHRGLDPSKTFDNFIAGPTNSLAVNAAVRMAADERPQFWPLYLQAPTGQGKTHLLHAIGNRFGEIRPNAKIRYCSAEKFMVEFVQAMRANEMVDFKERVRAFDLLLVDDIQFIIGKTSTQEEFLHTIDALLAHDKRLVITSDRAPQALDGVDQRLLSRLCMGLVADIEPADIELRRAILDQLIAQYPVPPVDDEVAEFLARSITRNVRELVGALNKLVAYGQVTGQKPSLALAEDKLSAILSANRRRITIDEIQRAVCQFYKIDRSEMSSKRRARTVVRPRQVAMYLAKVLTPRSYPEIGRKFGGRDHSTVIHAVKLIENLRVRDADMDGDVRALLSQLEN